MKLWFDDGAVVAQTPVQGISLIARDHATDEFVRQIESATFGTEGTRYRRLGLRRQLSEIKDAIFLELRRGRKLVGTYVLVQRAVNLGDRSLSGLYRGLLTIDADAGGQGLGRVLVEAALKWLGSVSHRTGESLMTWGCIEAKNSRALSLLESSGCHCLGKLETRLTYRQWPRKQTDLVALDESQESAVRHTLERAQADCHFKAHAPSTHAYYAVMSGAEILAGARVSVSCVDMGEPKQYWLKAGARLLQRVPMARRRFNHRRFSYLLLSDVIIREGHIDLWPRFLSALLYEHEVHSAMFVLDPESRAYQLLARSGLFGPYSRHTSQELFVLANAWQCEQPLLDACLSKPLGGIGGIL